MNSSERKLIREALLKSRLYGGKEDLAITLGRIEGIACLRLDKERAAKWE